MSEFEILNDATLRIQNWLVSRLLENIFHYSNFVEKKMNLIDALK